MTNYAAIKVHYDHRKSLLQHLKYSREPTLKEYNEYLSLYRDEGVGGEGFHECMNFYIPEKDSVKIYLPPTCIPSGEKSEDDFIIFTFTYKQDKELPAHIIGVHAGASIVARDGGYYRENVTIDEGIEGLFYHAEGEPEYVTLFTTPIPYNFSAGVHTPSYKSWGYGLRYLKESHAKSILEEAYKNNVENMDSFSKTKKEVAIREQSVVQRIYSEYFGEDISLKNGNKGGASNGQGQIPDQEIGKLGERRVFEKEIEYVKSKGLPESEVEWLSKVVPTSVCDIKTVRETKNGFENHYLEVKSSRLDFGENIYVSSRQIDFFKEDKENCSFVFVNFLLEPEAPTMQYLSLDEVLNRFHLKPIKYRLSEK